MLARLLLGAVLTVSVAGLAVADTLPGYNTMPPPEYLPRATDLYQGDLIPEMGLGCSIPTGNSGGPNDIAVGVTATFVPPFTLTNHFYYIYTQVSTTITALSFVCWEGPVPAGPGAEIAGSRTPGMDWSLGSHTAPINVDIYSAGFFFGHNQPQTNVGMRWGLDTSSSAQSSYIRAPACGASSHTMVDQLGFPGNWVMSVTVPGSTPVELKSWSSIKAAYN